VSYSFKQSVKQPRGKCWCMKYGITTCCTLYSSWICVVNESTNQSNDQSVSVSHHACLPRIASYGRRRWERPKKGIDDIKEDSQQMLLCISQGKRWAYEIVICTRNRVPGPGSKIHYPVPNPGNWYTVAYLGFGKGGTMASARSTSI